MGCREGGLGPSPGRTIDVLCESQFPYLYNGMRVDVQLDTYDTMAVTLVLGQPHLGHPGTEGT